MNIVALCEIVRSSEFRARGGSFKWEAHKWGGWNTVDAFGTLSHMLKFELNPAGGGEEPDSSFK